MARRRRCRAASVFATAALLVLTVTLGVPSQAAVTSDGELDPDFAAPGPNGSVSDVLPLPNGKLVVAGRFTDYGGVPARDYLVRLNPDGTVDNAFTPPSLNGAVSVVERDISGRLLISGDFTDAGADPDIDRLARLREDGTLDRSFAASQIPVRPFAIYPTVGGDIFVGGIFTDVAGDPDLDALVRLDQDGSVDVGFTPPALRGPLEGAPGSVTEIGPGRAGGLTISGDFRDAGGWPAHDYLARVTSNGGMDPTFTPPNLNGLVNGVGSLPSGQLVIGGAFTRANGLASIAYLARINQDGSLDNSFVPPRIGNGVQQLTVTREGQIVIGGWFLAVDGVQGIDRVARVNTDGTLDRTFVPPSTAGPFPQAVAETVDGKLVVGGLFTDIGGDATRRYLMRLGFTRSGPVTFDRAVLDFGAVAPGSTTVLTVDVGNSGRAPLVPESFTVNHADVTVTGVTCAVGQALPSDGVCRLRLTWQSRSAERLDDTQLGVRYRRGLRGLSELTTDSVPVTGRSVDPVTPDDGNDPRITKLKVKGLKSGKRLVVGRPTTVVRRVVTDGLVIKRKISCSRQGVIDRDACTVKRKKSGKIRITPRCTSGVIARVQITAQAAGAESTTWTRQWKVRSSPRRSC